MRTILSQLPKRRSYLKGVGTLEIGYPWLTYGAILTLEEFVRPEHKYLEMGVGGSTIFMSSRCAYVKAYDHDQEWVDKVAPLVNGNVEFACGDFHQMLAGLKNEPNGFYDWVLVDSGPSYWARLMFLPEAVAKVKPKGYLIVDNYNNRYLRRFTYEGFENVFYFDDFNYGGKGTVIARKR